MTRETKTLFRVTRHYGSFDSTYLRVWVVVTSSLAAALLLTVVIGAGVFHLKNAACERSGDRLERDSLYDFWGDGCFIETDDGLYVPLSTYRVTNEETS